MEKANPKAREYRFFSQKNQKMVCLHSEQALAYARYLEDRLWVAAYEACVPLELTDQIFLSGLVPPGSGFERITLNRPLDEGDHTVYVSLTQVDIDENGQQVIKNQVMHTMDFHVGE